jgi:hypothetical protein
VRPRSRLTSLFIALAGIIGITLTLALPASAATVHPAHPASCQATLTLTHVPTNVTIHTTQTCGEFFNAWGHWSNGSTHEGLWRNTNGQYSTACANSKCTQTGLQYGGYQEKSCASCAVHRHQTFGKVLTPIRIFTRAKAVAAACHFTPHDADFLGAGRVWASGSNCAPAHPVFYMRAEYINKYSSKYWKTGPQKHGNGSETSNYSGTSGNSGQDVIICAQMWFDNGSGWNYYYWGC